MQHMEHRPAVTPARAENHPAENHPKAIPDTYSGELEVVKKPPSVHSQKPAGIPRKFWDEKKQEIRLQALVKSYRHLERRLSEIREENKTLLAVMEARQGEEIAGAEAAPFAAMPSSPHATCPASPDDYEIEVNHHLFDNDPFINRLLHQAGFSNEQAQLVYDLAEAELMPIAEEIGKRYQMENDLQHLEQHFGGKARWREVSRQIRNWANKHLPPHAYEALSSSCEGILAMYAMLDKADEPSLVHGKAEMGQLDENDLRRMMQDPKYWRERDPATIQKVSEGFQRLYKN